MANEVLIALLVKRVEERLANLPDSSPIRGPRGQRGVTGHDGKDFNFSEHAETIRAWAKEAALKFEDFTQEQINALRGPKGRDGVDGKSFSPEEHGGLILAACEEAVAISSESLKLKFSDLSEEDISKIRGPRGRDGRDGKDGTSFQFEEHRAFFEGLKPKFSDLSTEEVERLRLHFQDLTVEEKNSLKLKFSDLTEEDRTAIRGARGARGQRGRDGNDGRDGKDGLRGLDGRNGKSIVGRAGRDGVDGRDGQEGIDAPHITDIRIESISLDEVEFVFEFSDGTTITSNAIKLPRSNNVYVSGGGVSSSTKLIYPGGQKSGVVEDSSFSGSPKKTTVIFDVPYDNSEYAIMLGSDMDRLPRYESKTANGFVINLQADETPVGEISWTTKPRGSSPVYDKQKAGVALDSEFIGTPKKVSIVFETPYDTSDYSVVLGGSMNALPIYESKTASGFVISLQSDETPVGEISWETQLVGETP